MPITPFASDKDIEWRLPTGGAFIITDEVGNELFRVTADGDIVTAPTLTVSGTLTNAAYATTATTVTAGASGTAGTVNVYPATGSKGRLALTTTDQTGNTVVSLVIGAMAAARTITLADPLAAADILTGMQAAVARTTTALGDGSGLIAAAGKLQFIAVTAKTGDAAGLLTLPAPTPGTIICGYVGATGFELQSSAPGTVAINGGTGAAAKCSIAADMFWCVVCTTATTWHGFTITAATLAAMEAAH
jgi:hypothetical protein